MVSRFLGDLLVPGLYACEEVAPEMEPQARHGVIVAETTMADGARGWVLLSPDGRTHTLRDAQIHHCGAEGCPRDPRPDKRALRAALSRELEIAGRRVRGPWTWPDAERLARIKTLHRALRSA